MIFTKAYNMKRLGKRKCKYKPCSKEFQKVRPLQMTCSAECAFSYARERSVKNKLNEMKIETHSKEFKSELQKAVNKIARMIDAKFGYTTCIDCNMPFGKQVDGAHKFSVGENSTLRYNLHNIHSARSHCNQYSDKHQKNYSLGLRARYGDEYLEFVESLPLKYKSIHVSNREIVEKLKIARAIIKGFDSYQFSSPIAARTLVNNLIGIYR